MRGRGGRKQRREMREVREERRRRRKREPKSVVRETHIFVCYVNQLIRCVKMYSCPGRTSGRAASGDEAGQGALRQR